MMRTTAVIAVGLLALGACKPEPLKSEPTPAERAADQAAMAEAAKTPVVLDAGQLNQVCQATLAAVHGQALAAVQMEGVADNVVSAAWRAPVDGGVARAQCRVEGDRAIWRPVGTTDTEQDRWMNQSGDPVARFALESGRITVTTTLPDGTTATQQYAVADQEEVR